MSKVFFLIIVAGLVVVIVAAINTNVVNARQQMELIQVSVLAEHQADYGVDEQVVAIPAVSVDIIEDAARDFHAQSSVPVITYTSLPTKEPKPDRGDGEGPDSVDEARQDNGQGNANSVGNGNQGNPQNNRNNGSNQNNGNGNGNEKDKGKNKEKEKERKK
jgi:hypothetical protein